MRMNMVKYSAEVFSDTSRPNYLIMRLSTIDSNGEGYAERSIHVEELKMNGLFDLVFEELKQRLRKELTK